MNKIQDQKLDKSNWILEEPLLKVFDRLLKIQSKSQKDIDGTTLGFIAKRLIEAEDRAGGPYHDKKSDKLELNKSIQLFFSNLGIQLENVDSYLKKETGKITNKSPGSHIDASKPDDVAIAVKNDMTALKFNTTDVMLDIWKSISAFDSKHEITYLSRYFAESLIVKPKITNKILTLLGVANFYAWMAYYIYDDVIDGEDKSKLIPVANILTRQAISKYLLVIDYDFISRSLNEVDQANSQELASYRFEAEDTYVQLPEFPSIAESDFIASCAIGHILGPEIILEKYTNASFAQKNLINQAFRHYLLARQLNDDAHDWIEDIKNGHMSLVLCFLFEKMNIHSGRYQIDQLIESIKLYFWNQGLDEITNLTIDHIEKSKDNFLKSELIKNENILFDEILNPIRDAALAGSRVLKNQKKFYKAFVNSPKPPKHSRQDP